MDESGLLTNWAGSHLAAYAVILLDNYGCGAVLDGLFLRRIQQRSVIVIFDWHLMYVCGAIVRLDVCFFVAVVSFGNANDILLRDGGLGVLLFTRTRVVLGEEHEHSSGNSENQRRYSHAGGTT